MSPAIRCSWSGRIGPAIGFAALPFSLLLAGCRVESNSRLEIGTSLRMPGTDLARETAGAHASGGAGDVVSTRSGEGVREQGGDIRAILRPAPASLDRSGWPPREFHVPYDGIRHSPSHTRQFTPAYATRSKGKSPTLLSALELGDASYGMGVAEGLGNLGVALFDAIVLVPEHLFVDPFWEKNQSPQWSAQRIPMRSWVGEVVRAEASGTGSLETMRRQSGVPAGEIEDPPYEAQPDARETSGNDETPMPVADPATSVVPTGDPGAGEGGAGAS